MEKISKIRQVGVGVPIDLFEAVFNMKCCYIVDYENIDIYEAKFVSDTLKEMSTKWLMSVKIDEAWKVRVRINEERLGTFDRLTTLAEYTKLLQQHVDIYLKMMEEEKTKKD